MVKGLNKKFNEKSVKALNKMIERLPGLADSLKDKKINLTQLDEIHVFGYGSLPDQPHYPPTSKQDAYLWDHSRDMCCKSLSSGTPNATGLTLGLDKNDGGIVQGAILSYKGLSSDELLDMLNKFATREVVTSLPIYKFEMLEVEKADGSKVHAITCMADPKLTMGYAGDLLTPMEKEGLNAAEQDDYSLRKKANVIASANGVLKKSGNYATGKSYFDRFLRIPTQEKLVEAGSLEPREQALYKEQERVLKLASYIDEARDVMRQQQPKVVAILEKREAEQLNAWKTSRAKLKQALGSSRKPKNLSK